MERGFLLSQSCYYSTDAGPSSKWSGLRRTFWKVGETCKYLCCTEWASTLERALQWGARARVLALGVLPEGRRQTAFGGQGLRGSLRVHDLDAGWDHRGPGTWFFLQSTSVSLTASPTGPRPRRRPRPLAAHRRELVALWGLWAAGCWSRREFLLKWKLASLLFSLGVTFKIKSFYKTLKVIRELIFQPGRSERPHPLLPTCSLWPGPCFDLYFG